MMMIDTRGVVHHTYKPMEGVVIEGVFNGELPLPHAKEWNGLITEESARKVKNEEEYVYLQAFAASCSPMKFKYVGKFDINGETIYQYKRVTSDYYVLMRDVKGALVCTITTRYTESATTIITASLMSGSVVMEKEYQGRDHVRAIDYRTALSEVLIEKGYATRYQTIAMVTRSGYAIRGNRIIKEAKIPKRRLTWQRKAANGTSRLLFRSYGFPAPPITLPHRLREKTPTVNIPWFKPVKRLREKTNPKNISWLI